MGLFFKAKVQSQGRTDWDFVDCLGLTEVLTGTLSKEPLFENNFCDLHHSFKAELWPVCKKGYACTDSNIFRISDKLGFSLNFGLAEPGSKLSSVAQVIPHPTAACTQRVGMLMTSLT